MDSDFFHPPLTERLKQILEKYPDGGQILKEKLQNAEDAGASEVRFVLDPHSYSRERIMAPITGKNDLARMQDGSLFVYNDAEFTKEDWGGIRSAGFSQKKEKVDKVGRFGSGFSSVYHLTDC